MFETFSSRNILEEGDNLWTLHLNFALEYDIRKVYDHLCW
jgi:hypothetical protein